MKIRLKLTLLFTSLFALLLLAFALVIYFSYAANREEEYYKRLKQQAITKANLLLEIKIPPKDLQAIYKNSPNSLYQEEVAIYDTAFHLLYHDAVEIDKVKETRGMIDTIIAQKNTRFVVGPLQAVGVLYSYGGKLYVLTAAARDESGLAKLNTLKYTLIVGFCIAIMLTLIAGILFSKKALQPVSEMVDKVKAITATHLDLRVEEGNGKDEMAELAITFNLMLDRIGKSFDSQKQFVSNISHELRTPISTIITELELSGTKTRTPEEYKTIIALTLNDAKKLSKLSTGLLDMAKASYDQTEIAFKEIRLDELLLDARQQVLKSNLDFHINIIFEREIENDDYISVLGNEYLLKVAFSNLIENACKFSENHQSTVAISFHNTITILRFADTGIGIPQDEIPHIFDSFYRGTNKSYTGGNGIGLSLADKIIKLHKGSISVLSQVNEGTTFTIELPHL
jgi:signal transduction histidine kinase